MRKIESKQKLLFRRLLCEHKIGFIFKPLYAFYLTKIQRSIFACAAANPKRDRLEAPFFQEDAAATKRVET